MLAAKILMEQGIEVLGLSFKSNFFSTKKAVKTAQTLGIELRAEDICKEELELVKNPPSGYGKNLNPCIDCHALMIKKAGEIARQEGFDIVATGEVLGQRPFSQNKGALLKVKKLSGVDVLRPLTAKLLPETQAERDKLVIRGKLHSIRGRTRGRQMELAKRYGIKKYPSPAGGCLLTDPGFSERLMKMLDYWPDCTVGDVELLKCGRVFWFKAPGGKRALTIIGRHHEDNQKLLSLAKTGDIVLELKQITGPSSLIRINPSVSLGIRNGELGIKDEFPSIFIPIKLKNSKLKLGEEKEEKDIIETVATLTGYYSTKARGAENDFSVKQIQ